MAPLRSENIIDAVMFKHHTLLLVEDNDDDVLLMRSAFRKAGVPNPMQVVSDGEEAIAYLQGEGTYGDRQKYPLPVVMLLDLSIPKKNGIEVLEWLRRQPALKRTTVHVLSASSRAVDIERAFEAGANAYLVKPSKVEALIEMAKAWHALAQFEAFPAIR